MTTFHLTFPRRTQAELNKRIIDGITKYGAMSSSTKIDVFVQRLRDAWAINPYEKVVVFSQFVGFLKIVESILQREDVDTLMYNGSMSIA
ncbi:hypothetical protein SARC_17154, partial [Sphaeroforma arctica JP610]